MDNENIQNVNSEEKGMRITQAVAFGTIVVTFFVVAITITGELYKPLKVLLTEAHSHHWVGKGIWSAVTFFAASALYYLIQRSTHTDRASSLIKIASIVMLLGTVVLLLFFWYEFASHA